MIPTLIGVAIITFFVLRVVPADIVEAKLRVHGAVVTTDVLIIWALSAQASEMRDA